MADLIAAESVQNLVYGKPHPLKGDRLGQFAVSLEGAERLVFEPSNAQIPRKEDGSIDWAREFLIPSEYDAELCTLRSREAVIDFAQRLGIHAGTVVGRLQYDKVIEHNSKLNSLKVSLEF